MPKENCLDLSVMELEDRINNKILDLNNLLERSKDNDSNLDEESKEKILVSMLKNVQELEPLLAVRLLKIHDKKNI